MPRGSVSGAALVVAVSLVLAGSALAAPPNPPQNTSPPVLAPNVPLVGNTVTVTPGTWTGEDATSTVSYQWFRFLGQQTQLISGATGTSHTVTTADEGGLTVLVTVTADSGAVSGAEYSNSISITIPSTPANVTVPVLSGKGVPGATLHVSNGTWSEYPSPIAGTLSYSYQWLRCTTQCTQPIEGATSTSYAITPADWGHDLMVKVTATDLIGSTYAYSNPLAVPPPLVTEDDPPFGRFVGGDPLLITPPPQGFCLGNTCQQGSVGTLLHHNGFSNVIIAKRRGALAVIWSALRAGREVRLGSERASFRKAGRYRARFVLSRKGKVLLQSAHALSFVVAGWAQVTRGSSTGCGYSGAITAARQIVITPACEAPPDDTNPF